LADALRVETDLTGSLHVDVFEQEQLATLMSSADSRIAALDAQISSLQAQIDATTHRIDTERAQISALARTMYAQPDSLLLLLVQSQDLRDAISRTSQYVVAGTRAHDIKVQLADDLRRLQSEKDQAQTDRDLEARQRALLQSLASQTTSLQGQALAVSEQLRFRVARIQAELDALGSQSPQVANAVRAKLLADTGVIIADARLLTLDHIRLLLEISQARTHTGAPLVPAAPPPYTAAARLAWPIAHFVITQGFGPSPYAIEPPYGQYPHFHTGIDLAAPVNSPVTSAADGVVALVGRDPWGYGNYIVVSHAGGLATLYAHLNAVGVAMGQSVLEGQQIGLEGSTGNSTGPHLHFEVRVGGAPVDPMPYLASA
jgi:murein DD-endopeptidase MepM/ murein hydrolase activator NlpD